jgi:hypothetical protein
VGVERRKRGNDPVLVVQLVELVEKRDLVEDAVEKHEEEVVHDYHEEERLVDLGVARETVISQAGSGEVQSEGEVPWDDHKKVDDVDDYRLFLECRPFFPLPLLL